MYIKKILASKHNDYVFYFCITISRKELSYETLLTAIERKQRICKQFILLVVFFGAIIPARSHHFAIC